MVLEAQLMSACPHGITTGVCILCSLWIEFQLGTKANCTHNFVDYPIQNHNIGALCDFQDGSHIAITSISSVVKFCYDCNALICENCYVG